jgi:tRNA pseudouridine38-40 synthase
MEIEKDRFRLTIAYDGRPFEGWQSQPGGNTVQDHILAVLRSICPEISSLHGSGRTDSGVCADGQVAHFDVPSTWRMDPTAWQRALNTQLPPTIRILRCDLADASFHARFSATGKIYRYRISFGDVLHPLDHGVVHHHRNLPLGEFIDAMQVFEGTHDFRAFAANRKDGMDAGRDTERTIFQITHSLPGDDLVSIDIHGNGFLYKMVRFLIGTGMYLATGKIDRPVVESWLDSPPESEKAPYCAPPDGLSLKEVCYE